METSENMAMDTAIDVLVEHWWIVVLLLVSIVIVLVWLLLRSFRRNRYRGGYWAGSSRLSTDIPDRDRSKDVSRFGKARAD